MSALNTVPIENTDLVRDMSSKAVLSTDRTGLVRYKEQRKRSLSQIKDAQETKQRLKSIEQEMASLKKIVSELATLRSRG